MSVPGLDLLGSTEHRLCRAHVQLQEVHTSIGVGPHEGVASGLCPMHVPTGQAQPETTVLCQQPLTQRQADAAAGRQTARACQQTCNAKKSPPTSTIFRRSGVLREIIRAVWNALLKLGLRGLLSLRCSMSPDRALNHV